MPPNMSYEEIGFLRAVIRLQQAALKVAEMALRPEGRFLAPQALMRVQATLEVVEGHKGQWDAPKPLEDEGPTDSCGGCGAEYSVEDGHTCA